jgi:hypothetical protein
MIAPYIGITDFTDFEQVKSMLNVFREHRRRVTRRKLHVGVMMSFKTLHGIETRWSEVFPPKEWIADIFGSDDVLNCLHYADYSKSDGFWQDLTQAISYGGIGIHAVQLDMIWPDPGEVANALHASRKRIQVILQIGKQAIEQANHDPQTIVQKLENYGGVIHRVLLDKSMGRGLGMDALGLIPFVREINQRLPNLGIGVAGGLGPNTMHLVEPLVREFPNLSIDAQGKLRPSGDAHDPINWVMAKNYLIEALKVLSQ